MVKPGQLRQLARCVLHPGQWDASAEAWARLLPCDSPGDLVARLSAMVNDGSAKVCDMLRDGARVGFIVFTALPDHELLIHAAFGRHDAGNLMAEFMPSVDVLARQCECSTVRFHTMRAGMIARGQRHGFRVSEVIMRKDV